MSDVKRRPFWLNLACNDTQLPYNVRNSFEENDYIYAINKVIREENKVSRTLCGARNLAGSATYKQNKTVYNSVHL